MANRHARGRACHSSEEEEADEAVCLATPESFFAVGAWYDDFRPTTDAEVRDLLAQASEAHAT